MMCPMYINMAIYHDTHHGRFFSRNVLIEVERNSHGSPMEFPKTIPRKSHGSPMKIPLNFYGSPMEPRGNTIVTWMSHMSPVEWG